MPDQQNEQLQTQDQDDSSDLSLNYINTKQREQVQTADYSQLQVQSQTANNESTIQSEINNYKDTSNLKYASSLKYLNKKMYKNNMNHNHVSYITKTRSQQFGLVDKKSSPAGQTLILDNTIENGLLEPQNTSKVSQLPEFPVRFSHNPFMKYGKILEKAHDMMSQRKSIDQSISRVSINQSRLNENSPDRNTQLIDNSVDESKFILPKINDGFIPKTHASIAFRRTMPSFKRNSSLSSNYMLNIQTKPSILNQVEIYKNNIKKPDQTVGGAAQMYKPPREKSLDASLHQGGDQSPQYLSIEALNQFKHKLPIEQNKVSYDKLFKNRMALKPSQSLDNLQKYTTIIDYKNSDRYGVDTSLNNTHLDANHGITSQKNEIVIQQNTTKMKKDLLNTIRQFDDRTISFKKAQQNLNKITNEYLSKHYVVLENSRAKLQPTWDKRGQVANKKDLLDISFNSVFSKQFAY
ncbi:UNKNOWN [Stylonychia lemnae]|uniref:Uncharacterized protein n=1 Tax=Stylonychia lemnae TaxID=5949 RepID=A0A078A7J7_STYLE|nr:UNKNOWN [Stylonychia lemnae]|eukprot:CDW76761.1 UNKNOWN [Stylonychia lemnae]